MTFEQENAKMLKVLHMTDEERERMGFRSPLKQLYRDFEVGIFHDISRWGYEHVYVPDKALFEHLTQKRDVEGTRKAREGMNKA